MEKDRAESIGNADGATMSFLTPADRDALNLATTLFGSVAVGAWQLTLQTLPWITVWLILAAGWALILLG